MKIDKSKFSGLKFGINSFNIHKILLAFIIFSLFFMFGCIKKQPPLSQYLKVETINSFQKQYESVNNCTVMVCDYGSFTTKIWDKITGLFSDTTKPSLLDKKCSFISFNLDDSTQTEKLNNLIGKTREAQPSIKFIQPFMIGTGQSVFMGDEAFGRCQGMLGINVIDLNAIASAQIYDSLSDKFEDINQCILQTGTIPLYKFQKWDSGFLTSLIKSLNNEGPVFISPGFGFKVNNQPSYPIIQPAYGSFSLIKSQCKNCITVLTVQYGDFDTIEKYKSFSLDWDNIDVIGFIVNVNNFSSCTPEVVILGNDSIKSFAQNLTERYRKPVLVLDISIKEGPNSANTCNWTNNSIGLFYDRLIRYNPELVSSGIIGISSKDISQLPVEGLNSFSLFCSIYYSTSASTSFVSPIIFSQKGDVISLCSTYDYGTSMGMLGDVVDYTKSLSPTYKEEKCFEKICMDTASAGSAGLFSVDNCEKDSLLIGSIASMKFVDQSLLIAGLDQSGYYQSNPFLTYQAKCSCSEYVPDSKEYNICCIAESLSSYMQIAKANDIKNEKWIAYSALYGLKYGESSLKSEFNKIKSSKGDPQISLSLMKMNKIRTVCSICQNIPTPSTPSQPSQPPQSSKPSQPPSLPPSESPAYNKALEIQTLATNNKIDYYLLLAALNYYNQIKEPVSSLSLMNSHCACSGLSDAQYNRCCIAETLSYYYYKKDVVQAAGTDTDFRKYLALYGLITGDAGLSAEIYRKTNPEISENYLRNPFIDNILKSGSTVKVE